MSPEEVATDLIKAGSVEVQEFKHLKVGSRVRHIGQRWYEAQEKGTGYVARIFHKPNSAWERKYGRPDVELIVNRDDGAHSYVADYHVDLAWNQESQ